MLTQQLWANNSVKTTVANKLEAIQIYELKDKVFICLSWAIILTNGLCVPVGHYTPSQMLDTISLPSISLLMVLLLIRATIEKKGWRVLFGTLLWSLLLQISTSINPGSFLPQELGTVHPLYTWNGETRPGLHPPTVWLWTMSGFGFRLCKVSLVKRWLVVRLKSSCMGSRLFVVILSKQSYKQVWWNCHRLCFYLACSSEEEIHIKQVFGLIGIKCLHLTGSILVCVSEKNICMYVAGFSCWAPQNCSQSRNIYIRPLRMSKSEGSQDLADSVPKEEILWGGSQ